MEKFYVNEIPDDSTIASYLQQKTDFRQKMSEVRPRRAHPKVIVFDGLDFSFPAMETSIREALRLYGDHGWRTKEGVLDYYTGFSLVHNPHHQDGLPIHASTLGTPKNSRYEFYWGVTEHHATLKNSYFDSYGFSVRTPASRHGALGEFLNRSLRTLIRSRVSVIQGKRYKPEFTEAGGWHKDEIIFENLRMNIPVVTSPHYLFQIANEKPVHLPIGFGYSWDTHVPHQVFSDGPNEDIRIHIVLGFSPWFDYLPEEQAWIKNEFYGKLHPFDMLADGHVFPGIKIREDIVIYS